MNKEGYVVKRRFFDHSKKRIKGKQSYFEPGDSYDGSYSEKYVSRGLIEKVIPEAPKKKRKS